ncbi:hypothetical protein M9H77_27449 [Catharanthus roseus]|uniref:Uncharacterized protein n=1 Tax=Catharanthus roseus TaxID=4058 RepID=A0ACC0ADI1_CATRO|nr:hypothetical protein M9H77_27449 [Catharanthus roseus]
MGTLATGELPSEEPPDHLQRSTKKTKFGHNILATNNKTSTYPLEIGYTSRHLLKHIKFAPKMFNKTYYKAIAEPIGGLSLVDLGQGYYIAKFDMEDDFLRVISGGPWFIYEQYLTIRLWQPEFNPYLDHPTTTAIWHLNKENKTGLGPWNIVPARKVAHRKQTAPSTTFLDPKNQPQSSSYVDLDKDLGENIKIIKSKKGRNKKVMQSKESISQTKSKKQNMQEKITNPNIHLANCKDLPGEKHVTTPRVGKKSFTQIENLLGRTHWYDPP